jgi:hypothetical protein
LLFEVFVPKAANLVGAAQIRLGEMPRRFLGMGMRMGKLRDRRRCDVPASRSARPLTDADVDHRGMVSRVSAGTCVQPAPVYIPHIGVE